MTRNLPPPVSPNGANGLGAHAMRTAILGVVGLWCAACSGSLVLADQPPREVKGTVQEPPPAPEVVPDPPKPLDLPGPIVFATGSDNLTAASEPALARVLEYMTKQTEVTLLRIEGHTDDQGETTSNQTLSERRALSVAAALIQRGVDCKRLIAVGFGESKPLVENTDGPSRAQNRRTVFIAAAIDGKEVGGATNGGGQLAGDTCKK